MATEVWANLASATVTSGGTTAPSAGTVQTWTLSGSTFAAVSSTASPPTVAYASDPAAPSEVFEITNVSGSTATVTRGADGTTPVTHATGFTLDQVYAGATLRALQAPLGWFSVLAYGADPSGAAAVDTAVNAAVSALPSGGGVIYFPPGTYKVSSGLLAELGNSQTVTIAGAGASATTLLYYGTGDCVRMYNPSSQGGNYNGNAFSVRSGIRDLTIDGANASAGACGLHMGDLMNAQVDVIVQNFSGAGSIGLHLDNTVTWTEQADIRASLVNNTTNVLFGVSGTGAVSFGYGNFDFSVQAYPGQDGVSFSAGALLYSSHLKVRGNFGASSSFAANAVLRFTGVAPGGTDTPGAVSQAFGTVIDVDVECNNGPSSAAAGPYTLDIDNVSGCYIQQCTGQFNYTNTGTAAFHAANAVAGGDFQFAGPVFGDSTINYSIITWPVLFETPPGMGNFASAQTLTTGATVTVGSGLIPVTCASAVTGVILASGSLDGQPLALYNTGSFSVTFAASGTSNVASGVSEVIPAGGTHFYMWSADNSLWYPVGQESFTAYLASNVESPTSGTALANVTGLAAYLGVGTWKVRAYLPVEAVTTGATAKFAFSFSGTAGTPTIVTWQGYGNGYEVPQASTTLTTEMTTGVTTSTTVIYYAECTATVTVTAAGTLQVQDACGTSTDAFNVLAGAFLEVTQVG